MPATALDHRNLVPPAPVETVEPYWDCRFSTFEIVLLVSVVLLTFALHLSPVLSSAGTPLIILLAALSYLSPATGFFYIACGQFLPFPADALNNPAQIGVFVWLPVALLRYGRIALTGISGLWPVLPWLIWHFVLTGDQDLVNPTGEMAKVFAYTIIACQLANEARGQYLKCLMGLCFGTLLVSAAYWGFELGLPVQINDWGGEREGFFRMGGSRADAVMVWPALLIGISGLLGTALSLASTQSRTRMPRWLYPLINLLFLASLPPLISTMCHGAIAGLVAVVVAVLWAIGVAKMNGASVNQDFRKMMGRLGLAVLVGGCLFAVDAFQLRSKMLSLTNYYEGAKQESGIAASRTAVWHDAINTIMKYPLLGIAVTGEQEEMTSEYASTGAYFAHNVFLDYGRAGGIPDLLLCALFFFWPVLKMWGSGDRPRYLCFILAHFGAFIFWMSLSFQFYKTVWGLWMLMAMAINNAPVFRPSYASPRSAGPPSWKPPAGLPEIAGTHRPAAAP